MRSFAAAWPAADVNEFVQQPVAQLPWGHITVLLDRLEERSDCDWYAGEAARFGWSRALLIDRISANTLDRIGAAPSNYGTQPIAVSTYTYDTLPTAEQQTLPSAETLTAALADTKPDHAGP